MRLMTETSLLTVPPPAYLTRVLAIAAERHHHLCPRQVLGARIGLYGLRLLGLIDDYAGPPFANPDKRLFSFVETDGCGADGVSAATNCWIGRRTLRVEDFGKVAATLVDTATGRALRVAPAPDSRELAPAYAPATAPSRWHAYLEGYRRVPDERLLSAVPVTLTVDLAAIISEPGRRAVCDLCGEEIMNGRELVREGAALCAPCAGSQGYARAAGPTRY